PSGNTQVCIAQLTVPPPGGHEREASARGQSHVSPGTAGTRRVLTSLAALPGVEEGGRFTALVEGLPPRTGDDSLIRHDYRCFMSLTIGLHAVNMHAAADPRAAAHIAALAENLGYDSLWAADHVVLPSPRVEPSPLDPGDHLLDPLVALSYLAGATSRIRLGTGCVVLPQRNPLVLAKQLASVDILSQGRLLFGAATGYLLPELQALGVQAAGRGERANEYL